MSSVFKNESILSPEFLPDILPFRETQIKQVAENIAPSGESKRGQNTFIFGSPGIGKTATVKFIFREFEEEYPDVKTIYINCWDFNTSIAVLSKITLELGKFVSRRGLGRDEINQRFIEALEKFGRGIVVCLDEVDQLIMKDSGALYDLLRVNQYTDTKITLVMISNNPHIFSKLESRVLSSLNKDDVEFKPYKTDEMKNILAERAKVAFSSFESAAILLAANQAVQKGGDVRVGLQCLQRGGRVAEKERESKLSAKHIRKIITDVNDPRPEILKKKIGDNEKIILDLVNKEGSVSFTELYEKYSKKVVNPVSVRMVQDYVKHLAQSKMIRVSEKKVHGKRMIYSQSE